MSKKCQYRLNILNILEAACAQWTGPGQAGARKEDDDMLNDDNKYARELLSKFVSLAESLDFSKAVAMHFGGESSEERTSLTQAWNDAVEDADGSACTSLADKLELLDCPSVREGLLHPLSVALLAFRLGGPINAANTAYAHVWKLPELDMSEEQSFHMEGDSGDFFEDHRITIVWETQHGEAKSASGKHHIFLTGDATPQRLQILSSVEDRDNAPMTIIYDSKSAALSYDGPDPGAVRKSITLDFHLNTVADDDIQLLSTQYDQMDLKELTLAKLLTSFPGVNYAALFHTLLFEPKSLNAIVAKLSTLEISKPEPPPDSAGHSLNQAFEAYRRENLARIPPTIKRMETDILITGMYGAPAVFLERLCVKACRSIHLPIGRNLFPQTPLEENIECARKFIRDLPRSIVENRLAEYAPTLFGQYRRLDLMSTMTLHRTGTLIGQRCLELISKGFVDADCLLPSIAALAPTFGKALNGPKEIEIVQEPWVDDHDLDVYGTRCLYLFWCTDWLVCYLKNPEEGPFMLADSDKALEDTRRMRPAIEDAARSLLRNWVAWGLLVEALPRGGFTVRQPRGV